MVLAVVVGPKLGLWCGWSEEGQGLLSTKVRN